jgi:hypothetical protein
MTPKTMKSSLNQINRAQTERSNRQRGWRSLLQIQGKDGDNDLGKNLLGSNLGGSPAVIGVGGAKEDSGLQLPPYDLRLIGFQRLRVTAGSA